MRLVRSSREETTPQAKIVAMTTTTAVSTNWVTVTVGIGHGKLAARNIDAWLRGEAWTHPPRHELAAYDKLNTWYYSDAERTHRPLLERARQLGAEFIATGHFARLEKDPVTGRTLLKRGKDMKKDQSYFLFSIPPSNLDRVLFPVGHLTKPEVRAIAKAKGIVMLM